MIKKKRRSTSPPATYEALKKHISESYDSFSKRLKQVARFALDRPNDIALETIAVIAERADVQPSTLIRFAKALGYEGFSEMQRIFRDRLAERTPSYSERIHTMREQMADATGAVGPKQVLAEFAAANIAALEHMRDEVGDDALRRAVDLLAGADEVHMIGYRRSFPVATFIFYALNQLGVRTHLLDGVGGLLDEQARLITRSDVLLAISFASYSKQVIEVVKAARSNEVPIIAITDSALSPLASLSTVSFQIEETAIHHFRSLSATMCLAQSLVISVGHLIDARQTDASSVKPRKKEAVPENRTVG